MLSYSYWQTGISSREFQEIASITNVGLAAWPIYRSQPECMPIKREGGNCNWMVSQGKVDAEKRTFANRSRKPKESRHSRVLASVYIGSNPRSILIELIKLSSLVLLFVAPVGADGVGAAASRNSRQVQPLAIRLAGWTAWFEWESSGSRRRRRDRGEEGRQHKANKTSCVMKFSASLWFNHCFFFSFFLD